MAVRGFLLLLAAVAFLIAPGGLRAASTLEPVTLQLKWTHAFQFAGYYAALEQGYYREAGLDVRFLEARTGVDPVRTVLAGGAQFGISSSSLLRHRAAGEPVVALAVLFQHSPYVLLAQADAGIGQVRDLAGRRVALEPTADELRAYLRKEGLDPGRLKLLDHSQTVDQFVQQTLDAMSAYTTDEPDRLARRGIPFQVFSPRSVGINFYGDNLFTTEHEIRRHPERVQAFLEASLRGWHHALEHPEAMVELILAKYAPGADRNHLRFEAEQTALLMRRDLVEVGYMNPARWRHIADVYADLGMLPRGFSMEGFLYQPPRPQDWASRVRLLAPPLLLCAALALLAVHLLRRSLRLQRRERRHRFLVDQVEDVVWILDLEGRCTYASPSVERLRGFRPEEVLEQGVEEAWAPGSADLVAEGLQATREAVRRGADMPSFRWELEQPCRDGSTVWTEVRASGLREGSGQVLGLVGISRDITERHRLQAALHHQAATDPLTGTWNRRRMEALGHGEVQRYHRYGHALSLLFVDLDRFKTVNDRFGHRAGDEVLKGFCTAVQKCLRATDVLGRWGGDEFLVLAPDTVLASAMLLAERIRGAVEAHVYGAAGILTVSVGVAECRPGDDWETLMGRADSALYRAKEAGQNHVHCASDFALARPASFLKLAWSASYASGQPLIDAQHMELFQRVDEILRLVVAGADPAAVSERLEELVAQAEVHFDAEIEILQAAGYPDAEAHGALHRELSARARDALAQSRLGTLAQRDLLAFLVCDVVAQHMLHEDARFFPLFR